MWNRRAGIPAMWPRHALMLFLLLVAASAPIAAAASDEEGCLFCHRYSLVTGAGGGERSIKVSDPKDAIHSSLYCSDCHGDARTVPHPGRPGATSCVAPCHAAAVPPESHRRASWGGLTEVHRSISQPVPPCLLCHSGADRRGDGAVIAARCAPCHPVPAATIRAGVHAHLADGGEGGACILCHPAHAASTGAGDGKRTGAPEPRCTVAACHGRVTAAMRALGGHKVPPSAGRGGSILLLAGAFLVGILPGFLFPSRHSGSEGTGGKWITAPASIPRYDLAQRGQHLIATTLFLLLFASAIVRAASPGLSVHRVHAYAGDGAALLLLLHFGYMVVRAVRLDLPLSEVAFLPLADPPGGEGKYSRSERGDYLFLLLLSLLLCGTGVLLRRAGTAGLSPGGYGTVRLLHLFLGAALAVHLFATHARLRLFGAGAGSPLSILTGAVPLATAERRPGWIRRLVEAGTLVPVPEEKKETEESREGALVRELLEAGNRLVREKEFGRARSKFEEALHHYPDYAQARFNLAVACMKDGAFEEAERQFTAFLEADPFNPMAEKAREYIEACREGRRS